MIDLTIMQDRMVRAAKRAKERNIVIPTFAQQKNPALIHHQYVIDSYPDETEIWPGMDHLARSYYSKWMLLRMANAPADEIAAAADTLLEFFPDSAYSFDVRMTAQDEETWGSHIGPPSDELRSRCSNLDADLNPVR